MRIYATSKKHGDMFEITDLYWFEENGVHDFDGVGTYDRYSFTFDSRNREVCEVCGREANNMVQDLREVPYSKIFREFEPFGEPHYFCDTHKRKSMKY